MKIKVKIPVSLAATIQNPSLNTNGFALNAIDSRIIATSRPEAATATGRTFTALIPAVLVKRLDADRQAGTPSSQIIVAALAAHYKIDLPDRQEMMAELQILITARQEKSLNRAVKTAKITRSEFIRRALADAVKTA